MNESSVNYVEFKKKCYILYESIYIILEMIKSYECRRNKYLLGTGEGEGKI